MPPNPDQFTILGCFVDGSGNMVYKHVRYATFNKLRSLQLDLVALRVFHEELDGQGNPSTFEDQYSGADLMSCHFADGFLRVACQIDSGVDKGIKEFLHEFDFKGRTTRDLPDSAMDRLHQGPRLLFYQGSDYDSKLTLALAKDPSTVTLE